MRLPSYHDDRRYADLAMTPMIDVVFLLLIFFICTASFQLAEELLPTSLAVPSGTTAPEIEVEPELERIIVRGQVADGATQWEVNERPCPSLAEVEHTLRAVAEIDRTLPVTLDVAGDVPLGDMIDVYDLSRLSGFEQIQFAAQRK